MQQGYHDVNTARYGAYRLTFWPKQFALYTTVGLRYYGKSQHNSLGCCMSRLNFISVAKLKLLTLLYPSGFKGRSFSAVGLTLNIYVSIKLDFILQ